MTFFILLQKPDHLQRELQIQAGLSEYEAYGAIFLASI